MLPFFIQLLLGLLKEAHVRPRTAISIVLAILAAWYIHAYRLEQALYYKEITNSINSLSTQLNSYTVSNNAVVQELSRKLAMHNDILTGTQVKLSECERRMAVLEQDSKQTLTLCGAKNNGR